jgi:hypothetical protein
MTMPSRRTGESCRINLLFCCREDLPPRIMAVDDWTAQAAPAM